MESVRSHRLATAAGRKHCRRARRGSRWSLVRRRARALCGQARGRRHALIERIDKAAQEYPYANEYTTWPGPNSNTFSAWIGRAVPELEMDLPATAIGKDYLGSSVFARAPSGGGFQVSLGGLLGIAASGVDGLEVNVLGLNFGVSASGIK